MNMIPCDCGCLHQKEGYCTLDNISQLTNYMPDAHCGHYTACDTVSRPLSPENRKSLRDI